jgi:hypothetical protein
MARRSLRLRGSRRSRGDTDARDPRAPAISSSVRLVWRDGSATPSGQRTELLPRPEATRRPQTADAPGRQPLTHVGEDGSPVVARPMATLVGARCRSCSLQGDWRLLTLPGVLAGYALWVSLGVLLRRRRGPRACRHGGSGRHRDPGHGRRQGAAGARMLDRRHAPSIGARGSSHPDGVGAPAAGRAHGCWFGLRRSRLTTSP